MPQPAGDYELSQLRRPSVSDMEEEEEADDGPYLRDDDDRHADDNNNIMTATHGFFADDIDRSVKRKLDWILLPFLALLFLLNSLDKSNIGNAETAGFTKDTGLAAHDLNLALALFFAFFVALQPVGAALGRRYGMARWVPACMSLWGLCTILHTWVRRRWQLVLLRVCIASLEAGFYPTTVSYLSLWYTRFEFAQRLGVFYGQTAVAGVLGGVLSWAVFSRYERGPGDVNPPPPLAMAGRAESEGEWRSWEVLFLIEGCLTMAVALLGFFWLPHSAETAWFLSPRERRRAEERIRLDQASNTTSTTQNLFDSHSTDFPAHDIEAEADHQPHHRLLSSSSSILHRLKTNTSTKSVTEDAGLTRHDILSALLSRKIWHILVCNILSAIPATAFGVFLPLVLKQLSPTLNLTPSQSNLLSAPPFAFGAIVLFAFTRWSDKSAQRLVPILAGLGLLLLGLLVTVMVPVQLYVVRYLSLCLLLGGSFIASPLTVAWLANNTPEPGKRAILLGINGWGNLAGVFSAMLFTPSEGRQGYLHSFVWTLGCVVVAFAGFIAFWVGIVRENAWRERVVAGWTEEEREREEVFGDAEVPATGMERLREAVGLDGFARRLGWDGVRRGDEKITFRYGL